MYFRISLAFDGYNLGLTKIVPAKSPAGGAPGNRECKVAALINRTSAAGVVPIGHMVLAPLES
jgi:hypothetical protein